MSSIPYNYGSYIDAKVAMTDTGHVSAGKQIQSPASAGSRGLAKTTQFTNDKTQMQLGQEAIAESMVEIRSILNRIDGVNAPVQEAEDDWTKLMNAVAERYGKEKARVIHDYAQHGTDSGPELMKDHGLTPGDGMEENQREWFKKFPWLEKLDKTSWMDRLINIAGEGPEYGMPNKESAVQEKEFNPNDERDEAPREGDVVNHKDLGKVSVVKVTGSDQMGQPAEYMVQAKLSYDELMGDVELGKFESYQPFPEADEFNIEEDEDFEEVLGPLGFPEDETELFDAEYRGRKVPLNKPMRGDVKKFKVYVKDPKSGNVKKVNFGHGGTSAKRPTMRIRKSNPKARKSFRARHNCANPGPKTKARYWSCRKW